jgi:hypothetical protein
MLHELSENGLANVHYPLSRGGRPHRTVLNRTWRKLKKVQIEKSKILLNLLTQGDLFALEKV